MITPRSELYGPFEQLPVRCGGRVRKWKPQRVSDGVLGVPTSNSDLMLIDDRDLWRVCDVSWSVCQSGRSGGGGYARSSRRDLGHRLILRPDDGLDVDHINGDRLDNRSENLRSAPRSSNLANATHFRGGSSRFKGVSWDRSRSKWLACVSKNGKNRCIGRFDSEEDAAKAYDRAAREHHGEFAYTNADAGLL